MKLRLLLLCIAMGSLRVAQGEPIRPTYYTHADGKKDSLLKAALHDSICGGLRYEYGTNQYHTSDKLGQWKKGDLKAYGTWGAFVSTDTHENGHIWDMYSDCIRLFPNRDGESACSMNIEHCLPKSWWGWSSSDSRDTSQLAYKDLYNLNPSDARANSQKSNYAPGHVQKADKFNNGSFRMDSKSKSAYGYICWEPAPEYRGDFARTWFYMATAYQNLEWADSYKDYASSKTYRFFSDKIISVLLDWHRADPVSEKEICRADRISSIQHNRNPYIDYPELVEYIWGNKKGQAVDLQSLECTAGTVTCPMPQKEEDTEHLYDTIISLPALTKALINEVPGGYASEKIQSNGTASITMGASTTDGYMSFSQLGLTEQTVLRFRASVYDTGERMQLDIEADDKLIASVKDTAKLETRNERIYEIDIPAGTDKLTITSVGANTKYRACMQELYLLKLRPVVPPVPTDEHEAEADTTPGPVRKVFINSMLLIERNGILYMPDGRPVSR
jgi:endonuclease I